ncbi:hypothetical protein RchiOBHm_Chr1g0360901 [Rosa chinensis]|uniref:Uncharacterized protein n=1 Tax=Rosa chinensis TaxID=74649 RepID=A0A2P6SIU0_ROSCH|nr:uncharacterized protein LOC112179199 [Rosa chinensis]PRQ58584.1 hypothetical protein RchiOBHm_Chr1g0360901 [Rosa chinensis]
MWSSHYLSPPTPLHPLIPLPLTVVSAKSQPQPGQDLGGLGRSFLTKPKPNPKPTNITAVTKQQKQKQEDSSRQISGSEVLFAMQKAAAKKRKETRKKKTKTSAEGLSSVGRHREEEEDEVDYSKVRPLCLKSDWGRRLDELEMRLQELSSKTI